MSTTYNKSSSNLEAVKKLPVNVPTYLLTLHILGPRFTNPMTPCSNLETGLNQSCFVIPGINFMKDDTVRSASLIKHHTNAVYPNITVCYPRFFDKIKMQGNSFIFLKLDQRIDGLAARQQNRFIVITLYHQQLSSHSNLHYIPP